MQKVLLLTLLAVASIGSKKASAQHFVTSFGVNVSWGVPDYISDIVYYDFYDYDWVHAKRIVRGHRIFYDVLLQRGHFFLELRINHFGNIIRYRDYDYYPLASHICGHWCGYHDYYYTAYYNPCHSHHHHGHNHIVYRPRPVTYVYGAYREKPKYKVVYKNIKERPVNRNNRYYAENRTPERRQQPGYTQRSEKREDYSRPTIDRQSSRSSDYDRSRSTRVEDRGTREINRGNSTRVESRESQSRTGLRERSKKQTEVKSRQAPAQRSTPSSTRTNSNVRSREVQKVQSRSRTEVKQRSENSSREKSGSSRSSGRGN